MSYEYDPIILEHTTFLKDYARKKVLVGENYAEARADLETAASSLTTERATIRAVLGMVIDQGAQVVGKGDTLQLTTTFTKHSDPSEAMTWTTDDADVATVSAAGVVTGVDDGTATITGTSVFDPEFTDTVVITVETKAVNSVTIDQPNQVINTPDYLGDDAGDAVEEFTTLQLSATVVTAGGEDDSITWSSDAEGVATVDAETGLVTAVSDGVAVITATSVADGGVTDTVTITVEIPAVSDVAIVPAAVTLVDGMVTQLHAVLTFSGHADTADLVDVTWGSGTAAKVTVEEETGVIEAIEADGASVITATSTFDSGQTDAITVTVLA